MAAWPFLYIFHKDTYRIGILISRRGSIILWEVEGQYLIARRGTAFYTGGRGSIILNARRGTLN